MIEPPRYILVIKSSQTELKRVEIFLREIFTAHMLPESCFNKSLLCLSEAIVNSIVHGNKNVLHKEIKVKVDCLTHSLVISVTDEGEGFDLEEVPDPTSVENIKKESGRGIHIIKTLSNSVEFNKRGNSLQFKILC
ncbi:ATP-binding protein [Maribellus luteus]|uniref:ATP-binding protein n=1 Tax=Maribellus luteus TaxID=2305463 RepID=UPI00138FBA21|nr:ATP-binding protein [Maribellus luteus]